MNRRAVKRAVFAGPSHRSRDTDSLPELRAAAAAAPNCATMATEAETSPALPPRSPSPTPSQCDGEYWDPPCKICKKVDNEDNVLCELCNGAYHLACIEGNYSKGLPRARLHADAAPAVVALEQVGIGIPDAVGRANVDEHAASLVAEQLEHEAILRELREAVMAGGDVSGEPRVGRDNKRD